MKAMVLAAGLGTRLRPLTNNRPKALVEIDARSLLEITLSRLRAFGISEVTINVHHFADMIVEYLRQNKNFGLRIEISREDVLLDTGGGLKKVAPFFLKNSNSGEKPFILHNVDVLTNIDLRSLVDFHNKNQALATLAVQGRKTSRYLLFDQQLQLCGRRSGDEQKTEIVPPSKQSEAVAFCGIHVISPRIFSMMTEDGVFSIIDCYLRLAAQGEKIVAFRSDRYYWRDLGKPENIARAEEDLKQGIAQ